MPDAVEFNAYGVRGLVARPLSVLARFIGPGAEGALYTGYDTWSPLDFYFSEYRQLYLQGAIKGVMNFLTLKNAHAHVSFSIVPVPQELWHEQSLINKNTLKIEISKQYKNAIVRAIGREHNAHKKQLRRMRSRLNNHFSGSSDVAPAPPEVDSYFSRHQDIKPALEYACEIRELWDTLSGPYPQEA